MRRTLRHCLIILSLLMPGAVLSSSDFTSFVYRINKIKFNSRINITQIEHEEPWYVIRGNYKGKADIIINTGASLMNSSQLIPLQFTDIIPIVNKQSFEIFFVPNEKSILKRPLNILTQSIKREKKNSYTIEGVCQKNGQNVVLSGGFIKAHTKCMKGKWNISLNLKDYKYNILPIKVEQKTGLSNQINGYKSILIGK